MLKTLLKHTIYELCIAQFFDAVIKNFVSPQQMVLSHQMFTRLVCAARSNGYTFGWVLYNVQGIDARVINGNQCIKFKCSLMRFTQFDDNTGDIVAEETTHNDTKWVSKDMLVDIDL